MTTYTITRSPVGVPCGTGSRRVEGSIPPTPGGGACKGVMFRVTLSRLEEGLGHEGFECDKCHRRVKYVPRSERPWSSNPALVDANLAHKRSKVEG